MDITSLSKRQQDAIPALIRMPTAKAAAADIGVSEKTMLRWLQDKQFQDVYRQARYLIMEEAFTLLQKSCNAAAQALLDIMSDATVNGQTRLQAAQAVLDNATKSRSIHELEERISELEAAHSLAHSPAA